jgi:diguanylate cyclase (GGDEF)-like protein
MELGELVGRLGSAILGVDDFHALLQEATELIATSAGAEFVSVQLELSGSRWEYRWNRSGLVPASFAPRPAARVSAAGHRSEVLTAGMSEVGLRCAVVAPVTLSKDDGLVLCVGFGEPGRLLRNEDLRAFEAVAAVLALGASRHGYQQMAVADPWTRLYNRRWLDLTLPAELERVRRYRQPLAVVALDIDHFKKINDTHGHATGDKVLLGVSRALQDCIRSCDAAVRIGGDEFLLILPETSAPGVTRIARRIEERVRQLSFGDARKPVRVTISGGASYADGLSTPDALVEEADRVLYAAKAEGRDRILVPEPQPPREDLLHIVRSGVRPSTTL